MSLVVWLPMTKDLRQQGLNDVIATSKGTVTLADSGKLGKCYQFNGGNLILPSSSMTSFSECTVAFWVKINSWKTNWDTFFQAGLGSTPWNNYIFGVLRNSSNYVVFTISNGSTTSSANYYSSALTLGEWMHLTFTYGDGKCKIYINGVLDHEYSTSIIPNFSGITKITIGRSNNESAYQTDSYMNDFRIYDHALSPMEVRELSKGLVVHYPLNRNGFGQENLVHNSNQFRVGGHASGVTPSVEEDGTYKVIAASGNSNYSSSWWKEITGIEDEFVEGENFTVSFWIKSNDANKTNPPTIYLKNGMGYYSMKGIVSANYSQVYYTGTWKKTNSLAPHLGWSGLVGTYYICQWKIEKGSIPTSWCPNSADDLADVIGLNENIEYDTSGFGNNGIRHGDFSFTPDSARYEISTSATGSATTYLEGVSLSEEAKTVSLWIKSATKGNGAIFNDKNSGLQIGLLNTYIYINSKANTAGFTTDHWNVGEWNHIVAINNNGTRSLYINGESESQTAGGNYYIHNADNFWLWNRSYNNSYAWSGALSDLRIYATALSADDVKALYENSAYVATNGTMYAYDFVES